MNEFEKQMMNKATEIVSTQPELKKQSDLREKHFIQNELLFEGDSILDDENIERRSCTEEEKLWLDYSIEKLGDVFKDANFYWQLDGALNISLYNGAYIGVHKDVDISIDSREIEAVESFLHKKGFGLFLADWDSSGRIFKRVNGKTFVNAFGTEHPMIMAISEDGEIQYEEKRFGIGSGIDTHIIKWDEQGNPIGNNGNHLPKEWLSPKIVNFNGREIHCSHPAYIAFHKILFNRSYDDSDLKILAQSGELKPADIDLIETTLERYIAESKNMIAVFSDRVLALIDDKQNEEQVFEILISDELVRGSQHLETREFFKKLAKEIANNYEDRQKIIYEVIFNAAPIGEIIKQKNARITLLRNFVKH